MNKGRKPHREQPHLTGGKGLYTPRTSSLVSQTSTSGMSNISGKTSRKRGFDEEEEDTSTLSSSRVEALEEEIERVTMENTELILENEKLRKLWETEKKEKEQFRKRIMEKALQTITMERETYAKVKRYAQEKLFRVIKFITSENDLKYLENPNSIASTTMKDLGIKGEDRIAWWSVYKVAITDGIADRRNQINTNMKTWVVRKSNPEIVMKVMMYTNKNITTPQEEMLSTPNFTVNNKRCLYTWTYRSCPRSSRCVKSQESLTKTLRRTKYTTDRNKPSPSLSSTCWGTLSERGSGTCRSVSTW